MKNKTLSYHLTGFFMDIVLLMSILFQKMFFYSVRQESIIKTGKKGSIKEVVVVELFRT